MLERIDPSPIHTLNRAVAVAQAHGPQAGLALLAGVVPPAWLDGHYLWEAVLADLHHRAGEAKAAVAAETLLSDVLPAPNASTEAPISSSEAPASNPVAASPVPEVYGDASYGTADLVEKLDAANVEANLKVQPPSARAGKFSQDEVRVGQDFSLLAAAINLARLAKLGVRRASAAR